MVGVPGKSKGCSTCRRRKKGCDQKRPVCGQCSQSGYVCGGYQRDLTFIAHPATRLAEETHYVAPDEPFSTATVLPPSLDKAAIEAQCRTLFWDLYLPHGIAEAPDELLSKCNHPPNWTSVLLELAHDESALDLAFSALSIARVGRSNNDMRLVKESTKLYGKALKDLQKALHDPARMHTEEVLAACSLLGLYEIFEGGTTPGRSIGWVSHAQGAAHLVESRGPSKHIERQAHHVFLGARLPIIYSALLQRRSTFLASEDWTTIPWEKSYKTKGDKVVDIMAKIPTVLEQIDLVRMTASLPETREALVDLLTTCETLKAELDSWEATKSPGARPLMVDHDRQENDAYPFEQQYLWENHLYMNATLVYWTSHFILATAQSQIELFLSTLGFPQPGLFLSATSFQQQARHFATCVAQSVPYSLLPEMGALGVNYITFPMCIAFKHFLESGEDTVCAWILQTCKDMNQQGLSIQPLVEPSSFDSPQASPFSLPSRKGSADLDISPTNSTTNVSAQGLEEPFSELELSSPYIGTSKMFKSTFIYENPAKYYSAATASSGKECG